MKTKPNPVFLVTLTVFFAFWSLGLEPEAWAKCDKEFADLQAAEQGLNNAQQAYNAAQAAHQQAAANLNQAVANLNAVAQQLGASGQATGESATFGSSPTNPSFFENPAYKAAKQAWQDAKDALAGAEGDLDQAGQERMRAQGDYDAAKKAYDDCMNREADLDFLRTPEPLKLDEELAEKTRELIGYHRFEDSQKKVTVDAHVTLTQDNLRVEFISYPPGKVRLQSAELVSPEGEVYGPKDTYEVSEEAARNLGRLRPMAVPKGQKKSGLSRGRVGSALLGTGLVALSGIGGGSHAKTAYDTAGYATKTASTSHTALSALGAAAGGAALAKSGSALPSSTSQEIEWIQPPTAGTGIFSSVADFNHPLPSSSHEPWHLKAVMDHLNGKTSTYTFTIPWSDWWAAYQKWLGERGRR